MANRFPSRTSSSNQASDDPSSGSDPAASSQQPVPWATGACDSFNRAVESGGVCQHEHRATNGHPEWVPVRAQSHEWLSSPSATTMPYAPGSYVKEEMGVETEPALGPASPAPAVGYHWASASVIEGSFSANTPFAAIPGDGTHLKEEVALNTYGFRKVDSNRWEFANEGFLRGQKFLLKGIQRRKPVPTSQQQILLSAGGPCLEVGKYGGLQGEMDGLRRDKNLLMSEVVRLRQQQQSTQQEISMLSQRLLKTEKKQQQLMAFLAKAMQNPSFVAQLIQKNEQTKQLESITRKRRLPSAGSSNVQKAVSSPSEDQEDGTHPDVNEELQALLYEMAQDQYIEDATQRVSPGMQDGREQSLPEGSQLESVKGNWPSQNAGKFEVPDTFQEISSESFEHSDSDAFWQQLIDVQCSMVATNAANGGELTASMGSGSNNLPSSASLLESNLKWESSKPDVDDLTKQMGHLGSSPRQ
ncbi:hypothetical protein GOP47_0008527 [Adiantum capillus-veneris]|uniref:HSF-type DNA-binding domain-containing protein n=1 Tax=Adiantum capillus-veneris TaxID=13818 RepID=A0A9D4ZJT5_ADICA|nr:hypothetical protein GOP47_0008527 [Adiantum capillus-veneris]